MRGRRRSLAVEEAATLWVPLGALGPDRLGAGLQLYRLGAASGLTQQGRVVLQVLGHVWMPRTEGFL